MQDDTDNLERRSHDNGPSNWKMELTNWTFRRACKTKRPDGSKAYGVWPLPEGIDLGDLIEERSFDKSIDEHATKTALRVPEWLPVSKMPSDIYVELMHHGIISDPNVRDNEQDVQWVGEVDWLYQCKFKGMKDLPVGNLNFDLLFDGLDTCATVWVNDHRIYQSDNAFTKHRLSLTELYRPDCENVITIHFASAFMHGKDLEAKYGVRSAWNGDKSRVFIRKPQYQYGWDWGPTLLTCGIAEVPSLHFYHEVRLPEAITRSSVNAQDECELVVQLLDSPRFSKDYDISATLSGPGLTSEVVLERVQKEINSEDRASLSQQWKYVLPAGRAKHLRQWWPIGYGQQNLYTVVISLLHRGRSIESETKRVGFRSIEVVQDKLEQQEGTSFYFRVNGVPIFLAGSNWIPGDSFPSRMTADRYQNWLKLLVDGGQNAVRVWGGGYYERDIFYDLCDEMGILVWQDFMFACGAYPADVEAWRKSVAVEAEQQVGRLGSHACLAIFAGNNEDYQIAEAEKLGWNPADNDTSQWLKTKFPARYIYELTLPEIVHRNTSVFYHPGSPWKTGPNTRDPTRGDQHEWSVWHGTQEDYQDWDKLGGRFVSEFGMHAFPDARTVDHFLDYSVLDRHPQSKLVQLHNKASGGQSRLEHYLIKNFKHGMDMGSYIYTSQLMQAECLATAYAVWRRQWKGPNREYCGGALVWQLNDVYPAISWSIVDYFLRPKPAWYAIRRAIEPITVNLKRVHSATQPDPRSAVIETITTVQIWGSSTLLESTTLLLMVEFFDIVSGQAIDATARSIILKPNQSTELDELPLPQQEGTIVAARLLETDTGRVVSRAHDWPQPYNFLKLPPVNLQMRYEGKMIKMAVDRPLKGLIFSMPSSPRYPVPEYIFSDNCFDIMPGDDREVEIIGYEEGGPRPYSRWYRD